MVKTEIYKFFVDENKESREGYESDAGKYILKVISYKTGKGTWNYTKGIIMRADENIGEIKRNYSSFPFKFVEEHDNSHDYLIAGEDYL